MMINVLTILAPAPTLLVLGVAVAAGRRLFASRSRNAYLYAAMVCVSVLFLTQMPISYGPKAEVNPIALILAVGVASGWMLLCNFLRTGRQRGYH
jgi:4-amino-4-deoxy-L-arabinose transferase-like glycosyltransferase